MESLTALLLSYIQENYSPKDSLFLSESDFLLFQNLLPSSLKPPLPTTPVFFSAPLQKKPKETPPLPSPSILLPEKPLAVEKEKEKKEIPPIENWTLDRSLEKKTLFLEEMRECVQKVCPSLSIVSQIPSDTRAKQSASLWKEELQGLEVILLSYADTPSTLPFLENVAFALNALQIPTKLLDAARFEKEKKWPLFFSVCKPKCILTPPLSRWKATSLSTFYKEKPTLSRSFLQDIPVLFLEPLTEYLNAPLKKKELWNTLLSHLSS